MQTNSGVTIATTPGSDLMERADQEAVPLAEVAIFIGRKRNGEIPGVEEDREVLPWNEQKR